ncbi:MAG: patatin-like phospholipase family protein [Acidimicrobiales bacterium]
MTADALPGGVFGKPAPLPSRFRRLLTRTRPAEDHIRTAFVLAGGGSRGAAQIGMLDALVERGIRPDAVYGTSVGAVNASGFVVDPTSRGIERMASVWRSLSSDDVFPHGRVPAPWRFLQQRESVHPNDGLRRIIEIGAGIDRFEDAVIPLQVVATSLTDGKARWFSRGPATEPVLASAALPSLLPPVRIDGEVFIDGGVVDNVPISRAIEQGCSRIFVLLCGPLHYMPAPPRRPIEAVLTAFFIAIHTRFARERENLPAGVELIVFCVGSEALARYDDFSNTDALITAGRQNAAAVLDFWERGGSGEIGVGALRGASAEPAPVSVDLPVVAEGGPERAKVPAPPA